MYKYTELLQCTYTIHTAHQWTVCAYVYFVYRYAGHSDRSDVKDQTNPRLSQVWLDYFSQLRVGSRVSARDCSTAYCSGVNTTHGQPTVPVRCVSSLFYISVSLSVSLSPHVSALHLLHEMPKWYRFHRKLISEQGNVTCHMSSQSVTCHQIQVN